MEKIIWINIIYHIINILIILLNNNNNKNGIVFTKYLLLKQHKLRIKCFKQTKVNICKVYKLSHIRRNLHQTKQDHILSMNTFFTP